ncbi:MAG: peptide-binding protein, partial [Burkholderiales bacterium]
ASHLAAYNRVDIALDTWPYNGATTTCEALWMGVPVLCLAGPTHSARMGASILGSAGDSESCFSDADRLVGCATKLANDPSGLGGLRGRLRAGLRSSALMDEEAFVRNFEGLLRDAWGSAP